MSYNSFNFINFIIFEIASYGTFVIYCSEGEPVGVTSWCRCCSSICTLVQFVFELVQNILNWFNFNCTGAKTVKMV